MVVQAVGVASLAVSHTILGTALCALLVGGTFMVMTMQGLREARRIAGADASRLMGAMTASFATGQIIGPLYASRLVLWTGGFTASLLTAAVLMAEVAALAASEGVTLQQRLDGISATFGRHVMAEKSLRMPPASSSTRV